MVRRALAGFTAPASLSAPSAPLEHTLWPAGDRVEAAAPIASRPAPRREFAVRREALGPRAPVAGSGSRRRRALGGFWFWFRGVGFRGGWGGVCVLFLFFFPPLAIVLFYFDLLKYNK